MPASELAFWEYINRHEFIGDERDDFRTAKIEATVMRFAGKSLKEGEEVTPLDCMPYIEKPEKEEIPVETQVHMSMGAIMGMQEAKREEERLRQEAEERMRKARMNHGHGN